MAVGRQTSFYTDVRKLNKQRLLDFIKEHPETDLEKVLGIFSMNTGLKVSTLKIYLDELRLAGLVE